MLKDTKSLGNNKAPACESRGFVLKKKKVRILTHLLLFSCFSLSLQPENVKAPLSLCSGADEPLSASGKAKD